MRRTACWLVVAVVAGAVARTDTPVCVWRIDVPGRGLPAVSAETVYFLTRQHEVVAAAPASGAIRWRRSTGEPGDATLGSSVVLAGDIVAAGDYNVVGLDARTGALRWRFEPDVGYGPGVYLSRESASAMVFAGSPSGRLYAVGASDGSPAWTTAVCPERCTVFAPIVSVDTVVAGFTRFEPSMSGGVVAVDRDTGRVRWTQSFPSDGHGVPVRFGGGPAIAGDVIAAVSGDGTVYGLDRQSGVTRWTLPKADRNDGIEQARDWRALLVSGSTLVAGSTSGRVTAWDVVTRRERWRYRHPRGGSVALDLTTDGRRVYVSHLGGLLAAVELETGREVWTMGGWDAGFDWAPVPSAGGLFVASSRGGLVRLREAAGSAP